MTFLLISTLFLALAQGSPADRGNASEPTPLELGYSQMYNLEFQEAHRTFRSWEESHPDDPLGPASDAAAFLFSEFSRLGILQSEFFADDRRIKGSKRVPPDPALKKGFESSLGRSEQRADAILSHSPEDTNALFARLLTIGLRADYDGLIEKRLIASLRYMKSGRVLAEKLIALEPTLYDAYLAIGVENYILGSSPAPVRWILQLFGAEANKTLGIEKVRLTAEKGHYLRPYAQLLLAVAALRDKRSGRARALLEGLAQEFPRNPLFSEELARLR
jgi:hypothetical protein